MAFLNHSHNETQPAPSTPGRSRAMVAIGMVIVIGAFFLLREHWGHVAGWWPYLLLLACPLMHLFHGHGASAPCAGR